METPSAIPLNQQSTGALLAQVVETKISRAELIDMIVEKLEAEINAEMTKLEAAKKDLGAPELTLSKAVELAKGQEVKTEVERCNRYNYDQHRYMDTGEVKVTVTFTVQKDQLPKRYTDHEAKAAALSKQVDDLRFKLNRLRNGKQRARAEIVRRALESTPAGEKVFAAINELSERLRDELTSSAVR